ncbi:transporter substrate-binding protein [Paracoccus sp. 1_MG-2023]|uniref:transporter substrate-binding protein n=1 Tax=unclassified Paracoccus (in: a-proteobacteria) TaxID=2688777 RepID=UPI001C09B02B|nr:transporter substrate-binding protein [Paracoccus sp. 1_MG-2023]MBU2957933.1 transporter substrate-binding protein [Paracoccus sp. C2R09]MDO6668874.1 transporter substrate-binding protein [Paracoccus sp. 1_MG-2023]
MKRQIDLGILFSRSGSYSLLGQASHAGAMRAIADVNGDRDLDIFFRPVVRDPQGNVDAYATLCAEILREGRARHIVGCTTSWSRKEVIPTLERLDGALWYPVPHEGFEASDRVCYTHACPNQHLVPLLDYVFEQHGTRGYLTGANYIWGWEMNRLAREIILRADGAVLGERYVPLGSTELTRIVEEIADLRPDFVLNQLIGPSQYAFLQAMQVLRQRDPFFGRGNCPVLSCNLTECELPAMGAASEGMLAAGPWFRGMKADLGAGDFGSSLELTAYASVRMLARLLAHRPGAEDLPLTALLAQEMAACMGIDRRTHHVRLPVVIARIENGSFVPLRRLEPIDGDPYLTQPRKPPRARLRVVT